MNGKMRSCVMGLILGQFSSPLPEAQKEPVAYLYNGVRLPKLPEWDREKYPFAYIDHWVSGEYVLYLMENPTITRDDDLDWVYFKIGENICFILQNGVDAWTPYKSSNATNNVFVYNGGALDACVWSNFDIECDDVMYFAASEPVPVYE